MSITAPPPDRRLKLLLVDDDPRVSEDLRLNLEGAGLAVEIEHCQDIPTARTRLSHHWRELDVLVVDLDLGVRSDDGIPFIRDSRSRFHALPIVVMSHMREWALFEQAMAVGAVGFIAKTGLRRQDEVTARALVLAKAWRGYYGGWQREVLQPSFEHVAHWIQKETQRALDALALVSRKAGGGADTASKILTRISSDARDVLDFYKEKDEPLQVERFSVLELVQELAQQFHTPTRQVVVTGARRNVTADPGIVRHCLRNLLDNAFRYSSREDGKPVTVNVKVRFPQSPRRECHIEVRDFGIGVTPEEEASLGVPHYRSQRASRPRSGWGIGLCDSQARLGRLKDAATQGKWAYSRPGKGGGALFTISFPCDCLG